MFYDSFKLISGIPRKLYVNGSRGYITSPRFPDLYPRNAEQHYLIEVPHLTNVYINFSYFQLEKDRKCVYDNVRIYDGKTTNDRLIARYCGHDALPVPVRTSGRSMLVVFRSDNGTNLIGFNATWVALEPSKTVFVFEVIPIPNSYCSMFILHFMFTKFIQRTGCVKKNCPLWEATMNFTLDWFWRFIFSF